jgi:hypothetical protein
MQDVSNPVVRSQAVRWYGPLLCLIADTLFSLHPPPLPTSSRHWPQARNSINTFPISNLPYSMASSQPRAGIARPVPQRRLLIVHISYLATMSEQLGEIKDAAISVKDNVIEWVGPMSELPLSLFASADRVISAQGHIIIPGSVCKPSLLGRLQQSHALACNTCLCTKGATVPLQGW